MKVDRVTWMPPDAVTQPSAAGPLVAIVLPPKERFGPSQAGAIGLVVHRLARAPSRYRRMILGMPVAGPFSGVEFHAVRPAWRPAKVAMRYGIAVARHLTRTEAALVEVHNRPDIALFLARRLKAAKVVLVLHNDARGMRGSRTPAQRARLVHRLDRVVTVSTYLRDRLLEGVTAPRSVPPVLPNSIDTLEPTDGTSRREPTILFVGRVAADKGADIFVAACAKALPDLPGWRAEIIGADRFGADSRETPFMRRLRPLAARAGVALAGYRPHDDVLAAMRRAGVVVVPSRWAEPFGMTALEAMACGAALVCSFRGGLAEVVGEAALRVDPDDTDGVAATLVALARDPARRDALGRAGRARAALFDVAVVARAMDALRDDVLGMGGAAASTWSHATSGPI